MYVEFDTNKNVVFIVEDFEILPGIIDKRVIPVMTKDIMKGIE